VKRPAAEEARTGAVALAPAPDRGRPQVVSPPPQAKRPEAEEARTGAVGLAPAPDRGRPQGVSPPPQPKRPEVEEARTGAVGLAPAPDRGRPQGVSHARLAAALARRARRGLGTRLGAGREAALAALDAFLAEPSPARFLGAVRALAAAERAAARRRLERGNAGRSFDQAIEALRASGLDADAVQRLADRPAEPRVGARLAALAALVSAHRELVGRAEAAARALRETLRLPGA
jgi:hypothetical protein